jgi:predicted enzyme related to lactoylglutathione lyase
MNLSRRTFSALLPAAAMARAAHAAEKPVDTISTSGIREVVFSTFDISRIAKPFVEAAGFKLTALPDAPKEQFTQWHVPAACTRIEQALLTAPDSPNGRGALRLVKFHGATQKVMRSSQRSWDTGGIFDIDVYSTDVEAIYRKLQRHGWTGLGDPVEYTEAAFHVRQVVAVGPDGLMVAIIERLSPPVEGQPKSQPMSPIFNSTQLVASLDKAMAFYTKTLGFETRLTFDITNQAEPGVDVLGLPLPQATTAIRKLGMVKSAGGTGAVELIENATMRGRDFAKDCVAPNVGILCLRIPVPNAAKYAAEITARGGVLYSEPKKIEIAPYGTATIFAVRSPEGAIIEFFDGAFEKL